MKNSLLDEQRHQLDKLQNLETRLENAAVEMANMSESHKSLTEQFMQEKDKSYELDRHNREIQEEMKETRANNQELLEELEKTRVELRACQELVGKLQGKIDVFEGAAAKAATMTPRR